jgi:hypothetical protein
MNDPTFPFIVECLASLKKKRPTKNVGINRDRNVFASGSGPNWDRATASGAFMMLQIIRQRIEALSDTASKGDVLKVLDECKPEETLRHPGIPR